MPITPFIGVRISWLILARNWPLARLAASARVTCFGQFLRLARQGGSFLLDLCVQLAAFQCLADSRRYVLGQRDFVFCKSAILQRIKPQRTDHLPTRHNRDDEHGDHAPVERQVADHRLVLIKLGVVDHERRPAVHHLLGNPVTDNGDDRSQGGGALREPVFGDHRQCFAVFVQLSIGCLGYIQRLSQFAAGCFPRLFGHRAWM